MRKLCVLLIIASIPAFAQDDATAMQGSIDFLSGTWRTVSTFIASGAEAPGTLTYKWVLGGEWMRIEFVGKHPQRDVWEAHGLMRWDPERKVIVSYVVFGPNDVSMMTGQPIEGGGISLTATTDGRAFGIDYHPRGENAVYQENWAIDVNGERQV